MAKETFDAAKRRILEGLQALGWSVSGPLKIPHATSPDGEVRLWFKPQAVWLSQAHGGPHAHRGGKHELGNARSIFVEVRGTDVADLVRYALHHAKD